MTIQQLQYVLALNKHKNFIKAADSCFVTQPTITTQLKKLEEEVGLLIFDRTKVPLEVTAAGVKFIQQAEVILLQIEDLKSWVNHSIDEVEGVLNLAIIPTISPYLLPLFVGDLLKSYPKLEFNVEEMTSEQIIKAIKEDRIDLGILAGPVHETGIKERHLFDEPFLVYASEGHELLKHEAITSSMLEVYSDLWLLEQGHCLSTQTINICKHGRTEVTHGFHYKSGSFDALLRMLNRQKGYTLVPYLLKEELNEAQLRPFKSDIPSREIVLISKNSYFKEGMINALKSHIAKVVPKELHDIKKVNRIAWR